MRAFGKYRLIAPIGTGGMAEVYLAVNNDGGARFAKLVVIKKLKDYLAHDREFMTMLVDEARIAARLNHPNVIQTLDVGETDGQPFLTMEYLDGQPLHRFRRHREHLPPGMLPSILVDVLAGLHHAHELKDFDGTPLSIIHRDVAPQNIFVSYEGQVKLVDFGIAKAVGRSSETRPGVLKGKIAYMAPEQAAGISVDRRADLFSIGVILYEFATGVRLWEGRSDAELIRRLVGAEIPSSPRAVNPKVDEELDRICRKALAYVPDDRYATALELQGDLEAYLEKTGTRCSAREIGDFVAAQFAEERTAMARTIADANVTDLASSLDAPPQSSTKSKGSVEPVDLRTPAATATTDTLTLSSDTQAAKKGRLPTIVVAALTLVVAGVTAVGVVTKGRAFGVERTPPPGVTITLRATPPDARFSIDDGPPLSNPFVGVLPEDGREHSVSAAAPGYASRQTKLVYRSDRDLSVRFVLAPLTPRTK